MIALLARQLPCITRCMLSNQLKALEKDGLIVRELFPEKPIKVVYSLSDLAQSLLPLLNLIKNWGVEYLGVKEVSCTD